MNHFYKILFLLFVLNIGQIHSVKAQNGVGLVLCGGGAKGFAHIGVLKILDSLHVPVDYVGGTSIGAIIGSLYALGYSGKEIEQMAKETDWENLFSDDANRNLIPFYEKNLMERYIATFKINDKGIKLPDGFISGQKILNFLSEITIKAHPITDFRQFKIPFFCIATDIGEGKDVVLENGFITTALRASMSIPTAFSAFEINGRLMIDGGIINNFPVDVMKEHYNGVIIGVDIQKGMMPSQNIESFTSVLNQLSTILDLKRFNTNKSLCDIYVHPDINGYSTMSFSSEAVDTLIRRGEIAARQLIPELKKYSCDELFNSRIQAHDSTIIQNSVYKVSDIKIVGQKRNSPLFIYQKLGIEIGKPFTVERLKYGIDNLYATNEYEYISYRFIKPDVLEIYCKERIINSIGVGINYEKGTSATVLLNYTHKNVVFNGDILSLDAKLSEYPGVKALYVVDNSVIPAPLLKLQYNQFGLNFYNDGNHIGNAKLNFGIIEAGFNSTGDNLFSVGLVTNAEFYDISDIVINDDHSLITKSETKLYYNYKLYTMFDSRNSSILPIRGNRFYANVKVHTDNFITYKKDIPMVSVMMNNERANKLSKRFTFLQNQGFQCFLTDSLPPPLLRSSLGGQYQADLYEYQFPFYGLRFSEVIAKNVIVAGFGLRYNVYKKNYVTLHTNVAAASDYFLFKDKSKYILGVGLEYTYLSLLGPLQYTIGYSNENKTVVSAVSLGFRF